MKKYFVSFTYRNILPISGELGPKMLSFDIIPLQEYPEGSPLPYTARSLSKEGVILALHDKGYTEDVEVIHMNSL